MQSENKFDQLSKRLAVAVSRRSLLRSFSIALAGAVFSWRKAIGQESPERSSEVPPVDQLVPVTKPYYFEVECAGGKPVSFCAIAVRGTNTSGVALIGAGNGRACLVPADLLVKARSVRNEVQSAKFTGKDPFERGLTKNKAWVFLSPPSSNFYSCKDEKTGAVTNNAFCMAVIRLDELVHKNETADDLIIYKRDPTPKEIVDNTTEVQCGGMSTALKNAIPLQKPTRLFRLKDEELGLEPHPKTQKNDDRVSHDASSVRLNATSTSDANRSGHKSK